MLYEKVGPAVFVVRYRGFADMAPANQKELVEAIRTASGLQAVALVFVIAETVRSIDFTVPSFWLKVAGDPAVRIAGMAMVTRSRAVEIAARGFGSAVRFRRAPIEIASFEEEPSAVAWARQLTQPAAASNG